MSKALDRATDIATILAALSAMVVAGVVVVRGGGTGDAQPPPYEDRAVDNWEAISDEGQRRGSRVASVTIVEFGDYECPACKAWQATIDSVLSRVGDDVSFVYRHYPLQYHRFAHLAARAAECAGQQGSFWAFHSGAYAAAALDRASLVEIAKSVDIPDIGAFAECLDSDMVDATIARDLDVARSLEARGTPAILVNGWLLGSIPTVDELVARIEDLRR